VHVSKVRSLTLDAWPPELIQVSYALAITDLLLTTSSVVTSG
jgi:hypothetical protein